MPCNLTKSTIQVLHS